jgi:hypothetical protein
MKKILLCIAVLLIVASCENDYLLLVNEPLVSEKSAHVPVFPEVIPLPDGFQPEGIAIGTGQTFYVGSLSSGQIYKGNLRTGEGELLYIPAGPDQTVGLSFDQRSGYLFAAKGFTGMGAVYNSETGDVVQSFTLAAPMTDLINDVVVSKDAAFFTGSFTSVLYKVPLIKNGQLPDPVQVIPLALSGDFSIIPNSPPQLGIFSNGIDVTENGEHLILANMELGEIYRVNPNTGEAIRIDLNGSLLPFADGILLEGHILYVVQNFLNQVAVINLYDDFLKGEIVEVITHPKLGIPTTVDRFGNQLYLVNAHFDVAPPDGNFPEVEFEVVKVPKYNGND